MRIRRRCSRRSAAAGGTGRRNSSGSIGRAAKIIPLGDLYPGPKGVQSEEYKLAPAKFAPRPNEKSDFPGGKSLFCFLE